MSYRFRSYDPEKLATFSYLYIYSNRHGTLRARAGHINRTHTAVRMFRRKFAQSKKAYKTASKDTADSSDEEVDPADDNGAIDDGKNIKREKDDEDNDEGPGWERHGYQQRHCSLVDGQTS